MAKSKSRSKGKGVDAFKSRSKAKRRSSLRDRAAREVSLRDRAAREAWWRGCVREWERSGESQAGFARRKGVAYATFNGWKLRILEQKRGSKRMAGARSFARISRSAAAEAKGRGGRRGLSRKRGSSAVEKASHSGSWGVREEARSCRRERACRGREGRETSSLTRGAARGCPGRTRPVLLPVEVKPAVAAASWSVEIECRNGRVLRLRDLLDAGALSALLGALEAERRC